MKDTEGNVTDIAYDGLDAVSETDQSGKSSSAAVYDKYGNQIQSSKDLSASTNILKDGSFEAQKSGWNLTASKDSGKISVIADKSGVLSGSKALEVLSQSTSAGTDHGYSSATQTVELEPNTTYTLSGKIKTDLAKSRAYLTLICETKIKTNSMDSQ